jgi:hypothetical protein
VTPDDKSAVTRETQAASDSWWKYVGWGNADGSATPGKLVISTSPDTIGTPLVNVEPATPEVKQRAQSVHDLPMAQDGDASHETEKKVVNKAMSLRSAETASSAWYQPWSWYSNAIPATEGGASTSTGEEGRPKTESEKVKEEALARDSGDSAAPKPEPEPEPTPSTTSSVNPIESTIASNRSVWTSFFSSKSLVVKNISGGENMERDEHGAEVMNVEEDVGGAAVPGSSPSSATNVVQANVGKGKEGRANGKDGEKKGVEKPTLKPTKDIPPSSPRKPEGSSAKAPSDLLASPLTNSSPVKREMAKTNQRTPSPSPTKKSGANSPKPSPPNLVLPTWADTFHAPPRSLLPPQPPSAIKKTFNFVSDVLFAKEDSVGKGKAKAKEKDFEHFGKQLPRTWEVVGGKSGLHPDVLRGCRRAVVIGIHGWFPGASWELFFVVKAPVSHRYDTRHCCANCSWRSG